MAQNLAKSRLAADDGQKLATIHVGIEKSRTSGVHIFEDTARTSNRSRRDDHVPTRRARGCPRPRRSQEQRLHLGTAQRLDAEIGSFAGQHHRAVRAPSPPTGAATPGKLGLYHVLALSRLTTRSLKARAGSSLPWYA
jgi:hypothetical protein